jgi:N6-adenosine-specific RNA methylase IME4
MSFDGLTLGRYATIACDPPWSFAVRSPKGLGRSAERHYGCMTLDDIKRLPVADLAQKDCCLLMWVTDPMLSHGLDVIKAWGFTFKTVGFYWTKRNADGSPFTGMGYYTRANPEQCLLATRGNPRRQSRSVRRWIDSPRREHSRKPDEFFDRAEALMPGPYAELFGRQSRPNWDCWGHESTCFDEAAE